MRHRGRTPPFRTATGEILPGSIAEIGYQRLGGIDQWVMIRGESLTNPPLVHLHGGPGFTEMRLFRHFNAPLEKSFRVIYWDQRGKSLVEHGTNRARRDGIIDLDLPNLLRGFRFSLDAMWAEVSMLNLLRVAPALQMPVFFFLGRRDYWVPPEASVAYFDALTAPSKRLVWFGASGHEPFVDESATFNRAMVELVRPVTV